MSAARRESPETQSEPTSAGQPTPAQRADAASAGRRRSTPPRVRAAASAPEPETPSGEQVSGIVGDASASVSRSGEDVRKRGWFWHWNSIVTQYAPLLGLKGVGLLNSYTVWTDRREESPHRGYAFPSQQSEADFYGEDRAELITINKILVALDLIEIRKEMVLRVDAQGRRWKVPHNLYRVKDHGDDVTLTTKDVLRVIELADRDRAVYRYLRRVFSPRFSPIDHANVWHQILEEVRPSPVWQRLAARAEKEERKASERTKAGHASRKGSAATSTAQGDAPGSGVSAAGEDAFLLPEDGDTGASEATEAASNANGDNDSAAGVATGPAGRPATIVASSNRGSQPLSGTDVEPVNNGSGHNRPGVAGPSNTGRQTTVAPSNTTYHQSQTTTTEVDGDDETGSGRRQRPEESDRFGTRRTPDASRDETIALQRFAEANDRQPTAAERRHLRQLAEFAGPIVEPGEATGWALVGFAIEEAVSSGSSFVAPKRIREILARWSRDGVPMEYGPDVRHAPLGDERAPERPGPVTRPSSASHRSGVAADPAAVEEGVLLPNGRSAQVVWGNVGREVAVQLGAALADRLLAGTAIEAYDAGAVTIRVPDRAQAEALLGEHEALIGRALRAQLRRPVRLAAIVVEAEGASGDEGAPAGAARERDGGATGSASSRRVRPATLGAIPVFAVERCGLTNRQLWATALGDLRAGDAIPAADIDAWLRDAALLAMDEEDGSGAVTFTLGVPHVLAQRRVEARFRPAISAALAHLLDSDPGDVGIVVTLLRDWNLRQSA